MLIFISPPYRSQYSPPSCAPWCSFAALITSFISRPTLLLRLILSVFLGFFWGPPPYRTLTHLFGQHSAVIFPSCFLRPFLRITPSAPARPSHLLRPLFFLRRSSHFLCSTSVSFKPFTGCSAFPRLFGSFVGPRFCHSHSGPV